MAGPEKVAHKRFNPLSRQWILVSPQRTQRPWQGQREEAQSESRPHYDPSCYLCPGNERAGGAQNPDYSSTFFFENDFPALKPEVAGHAFTRGELLVAEPERGICEVGCFSPRHDLTLPLMTTAQLVQVIDLWCCRYRELGARGFIRYVQIFENKGEMMGCSNPHPHCQIWANETLPNEPAREQISQAEFLEEKGECLLCRYLQLEEKEGERLVLSNEHFVVLVPFWAIWPFEVLLLPREHVASFEELTKDRKVALAQIIKEMTTRFDNLFRTSFPYSMGFHPAPTDGKEHPEWHFHAHYYPPLLRSATVKKFMVGYEMLGTPQRDITAEDAAQRLREQSAEHFLHRRNGGR